MTFGLHMPARLRILHVGTLLALAGELLLALLHLVAEGPGSPRLPGLAVLTVLTAVGAAVYRKPGRWVVPVLLFNTVACTIGLAVLAAAGEGTRDVYFQYLFAMPLVLAVLALELRLVTVLATVAALASGLWLHLREGTQALPVMLWTVLMLTSGLFAWLGVRLHQRLCERERQAHDRLAQTSARAAEAERLAGVGRLAAGVAHEINNPLAFVKANLSWLDTEHAAGTLLDDPEELRSVIADARLGVERVERIVRDLKTLGRDGADPLEAVQLADAVEQAVRLSKLRLAAGVEVRCALEAALPSVTATPGRLVQVLVNLLANAADAGARTVSLTAELLPDAVLLRVEDDGPGIPEALRARVFEPFFTTKAPQGGTGLGLALSREYLGRAGGALRLCSSGLGGAGFLLQLRRADAQVHAGSAAADETP